MKCPNCKEELTDVSRQHSRGVILQNYILVGAEFELDNEDITDEDIEEFFCDKCNVKIEDEATLEFLNENIS